MPVIILLGLWLMLTSSVFILGLYLFSTEVNYVPLLFYAMVIARKGSAKKEVEYGLAHNKHCVRKYSLQQLVIFIPLVVLLVALAQEVKRTTQS